MDNIKTQGERITFVELIKKHKIQIPLIQRDYAQGRKSAKVVRDNFLIALHTYLSEEKPNRDLDFVYGSLQNSNFVPLDGQQRLTTLFLLHWYLALKEDKKDDFRAVIIDEGKSKFTYETRISSSDFCNALVNSDDVNLNTLINSSIKSTIQDKKWYFSSWNQDPTIDAMLNMLDAIHEKFNNTKGFYEKLVYTERPIITFLFLNLDDLKLSDDLYIKMNSRGKPLSTFENFKAKFEEYLQSKQDNYEEKNNFKIPETSVDTIQKYFSHKIDTDWLDLFWSLSTKSMKESDGNKKDIGGKTDRRIMNFIRTLAINRCAVLNNQEGVKFLFKTQIDNIHFHDYKEIDCLDETFVINIIKLLDLFRSENGVLRTYNVDSFFYDESKIFESVALNFSNNNAEYEKHIQFFAYCQYLILWETHEGLNDWMRVVVNLTENTIYNREEQFISSINVINTLLPNSNQILQHLADTNSKSISSFLPKQIEEEIIKAKLILKNNEWSKVIRETEKRLEYFECQITHLLSFSGIIEYHEKNKDVNWSEIEDENYYNEFVKYRKISESLFDKNGLKIKSNHLFERTLLCFGNYLLTESNNLSFLIDSDRDISWKRYLLGDKEDGETKRNYFKQLINDVSFDPQNVIDSLEHILKSTCKNINDWKRNFTNQPVLFDDLGNKKYLRKVSNTKIYLLQKERTSGSHSELNTRAYFLKNELDKINYKYYCVSGESDEPYIGFNWLYEKFDYEIKIESNYDDAKNFILKFIIPKDWKNEVVEEILKHNNLIKQEGKEYFEHLIVETDLLEKLNQFRDELNNLSMPNTL